MKKYIEAEKAIKYFENNKNFAIHRVDIVAFLSGLKSIEAEEVKNAEWIKLDKLYPLFSETYQCSRCGRTIIVGENYGSSLIKDYPYCHCGAKMKRGKKK